MKIGIKVYCRVCGKTKAPHGRSIPSETANSYCHLECAGYETDPLPGCLLSGETSEEFGYAFCQNSTEDAQ